MLCLRVFRTRKEAENAKTLLEQAGIIAVIKHDKFNNSPIEKFGVPARFKLIIPRDDLNKAASFLAKQIRIRKK